MERGYAFLRRILIIGWFLNWLVGIWELYNYLGCGGMQAMGISYKITLYKLNKI